MGTVILGWILIVVGVVGTTAGVGGGVTTMFKEIKRKADEGGLGGELLPTEFLKALTEFLNALVKAPTWLALVIIGFLLIVWGGTMI